MKKHKSQRTTLSRAELELARDMGASTYLASYIWLMSQELKVENIDNDSVNAMAALMVEPLNFGTQAAFCMLMNDHKGAREAMEKMRQALNTLAKAA